MWDGHRCPNSEGIKQTIRCKSVQPLWDEATLWGLGMSALRSRFRGTLTPVGQADGEWTPVGDMIGQCSQLQLLIWNQSLDCIARNLDNIVLNASGCSNDADVYAVGISRESWSLRRELVVELLRKLRAKDYEYKRIAWEYNGVTGEYIFHTTVRAPLVDD